MNVTITPARKVSGSLRIPADKSICHRAVLVSALAEGQTRISPWPQAEDCQHTLGLVRNLGVRAQLDRGALKVEGVGNQPLTRPNGPLHCGESGTTLRLSAGLLSGQPFESELDAALSLRRRPMQRIISPLSEMGVSIRGKPIEALPQEVGPPLIIKGKRPLKAIRYEMPVASAQVKSAILFAGLAADSETTVIERDETRNHTEELFRHFGLTIRSEEGNITLQPGPLASPGTLHIPGDISSAAFFIVAGCCASESSLVLQAVSLNPTRVGLLRVLEKMGAFFRIEPLGGSWEARGDIHISPCVFRGSFLKSPKIPAVIDELPILMVAASRADGTTRIEGIQELRVKETDRVESMVEGLGAMGAQIRTVGDDCVEIEGGALKGAVVDSFQDHRTAMSLAVAALTADGSTTIRNAECVSKSFPEFFTLLSQITPPNTVQIH